MKISVFAPNKQYIYCGTSGLMASQALRRFLLSHEDIDADLFTDLEIETLNADAFVTVGIGINIEKDVSV